MPSPSSGSTPRHSIRQSQERPSSAPSPDSNAPDPEASAVGRSSGGRRAKFQTSLKEGIQAITSRVRALSSKAATKLEKMRVKANDSKAVLTIRSFKRQQELSSQIKQSEKVLARLSTDLPAAEARLKSKKKSELLQVKK